MVPFQCVEAWRAQWLARAAACVGLHWRGHDCHAAGVSGRHPLHIDMNFSYLVAVQLLPALLFSMYSLFGILIDRQHTALVSASLVDERGCCAWSRAAVAAFVPQTDTGIILIHLTSLVPSLQPCAYSSNFGGGSMSC